MLNAKQKRFCEEYVVDFNATQAAIRAGYSGKTAHSQGPRLLENVEVNDYVNQLQGKKAEKAEVKVHDVVRELCKMAHLGVTSDDFYCDITGEPLPINELSDKAKACISHFEPKQMRRGFGKNAEYYVQMVPKFHNKEKAIELLGRHLSMFTDKVDVTGEFNLASLVKEIHDTKN